MSWSNLKATLYYNLPMKNLIYALILSIIIHILFLSNYKVTPVNKDSAQNKADKKVQASNVRFVKLQQTQKESEPKKTVEKKEPPKPLKKVKEQKPQPKRPVVKEAKKTVPKPTIKSEAIPNYMKPLPNKPKTDLQKAQKKLQKENLSDYMVAPNMDYNMLDQITKSYLKLYGEEYNSFTEVQKIFLKNNLRDIGRITEHYLRYPYLAIRLKQQGTNIVEFILYPNGDISDLRLSSSSGSTSLDENTIETIKIAYKDYPRPKEPTKIKIYVNYFGNFY